MPVAVTILTIALMHPTGDLRPEDLLLEHIRLQEAVPR